MNDTNPNSFDASLKDFLSYAFDVIEAYYEKSYPNLKATAFRVEAGRRYVRVIRENSAYCFVDLTNGDILKPASWKAPAKHARGNIYNSMTWTCVGVHGIAYLTHANVGGAHVNNPAMARTEKKAAVAPAELPKRADKPRVFVGHTCRSQPCEYCMST